MAMTPERARELLPLACANDLDPETCAAVRDVASRDPEGRELLARYEALEGLLVRHAGEPQGDDPAWVKRLAGETTASSGSARSSSRFLMPALFLAAAAGAMAIGAAAGFKAGVATRWTPSKAPLTPERPSRPIVEKNDRGSDATSPAGESAPEAPSRAPESETPPEVTAPIDSGSPVVAAESFATPAVVEARPLPFVHLQTDKPAYRLGDTIWYRIHTAQGETTGAITVKLIGDHSSPDGTPGVAAMRKHAPEDERSGSFLLREDRPGGEFRLVAECGDGVVAHEIRFPVYALLPRTADLSLSVLGDSHERGETATAVFAAVDRRGQPIVGVKPKWRATFGSLDMQGEAGPTDFSGHSVIRFQVPDDATTSGFLSAGIEHDRKLAVVSQPFLVTTGVSSVEVFPEGGTIVAGGEHRFGIFVRDGNGEPALAEGTIVDEDGGCVAAFATDRRGLALVSLPCEKGHRYEAKIDRPSNVAKRFPLPGPTGHAHAVRVIENAQKVEVEVRGKKTSGATQIFLARGDRILSRAPVTIAEDGGAARVVFPGSRELSVARLVLKDGDKAELDCPLLLGTGSPVKVELKPREGPHLPGDLVTVDIETTRDGSPCSTELALSVFDAGLATKAPWACADLGARLLLHGIVSGSVSDVGDLLSSDASDSDKAAAYVMVHGSCSFPREGLVTAGADALPDSRKWMLAARPFSPRPRKKASPPVPNEGETVARGNGLEKLLEIAPFARTAGPESGSEEQRFAPADEDEAPSVPGHGELATKPPQDVELPSSRPDCRESLFWKPSVVTGPDGRGSVSFRIGPVAPCSIVAQGIAGDRGATRVERFAPRASFASRFGFPSRVSVGDRFEVDVTTEIRDSSKDPLRLEVDAPTCLKTIERQDTSPSKNTHATKLVYEVVSPAREACFRVTASRGAYHETCTRTFEAGWHDVELSLGRSGFQRGNQALTVRVPENAVLGSVCARSVVVPPTPVAEAFDGIEQLLGEPNGCFEQTTALYYQDLVVLERLQKAGTDATVLARASDLANRGFDKLRAFQNPGGGFGLFPGGPADLKCTSLGVMQLSAYARLHSGKGSSDLARALKWLGEHDASDNVTLLYAAFAATDAGVSWKGSAKALEAHPNSNYEHALLASTIALWKGDWPLTKPRNEMLDREIACLEKAIDRDGAIASDGCGIMGSSGRSLSCETTGFAVIAFENGGRHDLAERCICGLSTMKLAAKCPWAGAGLGTQALMLTVRAFSSFLGSSSETLPTDPMGVELAAAGRAPVAATVGTESGRPLLLAQELGDVKPGEVVDLELGIRAPRPVEYGLACSYRVASPTSAREAPYRISTQLDRTVAVGEVTYLRVAIDVAHTAPVGQVCAILSLPGGLQPQLEQARGLGGSSHAEVKDGALVLYWEHGPTSQLRFAVPVRATTMGRFTSLPSVVYPYYESGKEAYAPGLSIEIRPERGPGSTVENPTEDPPVTPPEVPPMKPTRPQTPPPGPVTPVGPLPPPTGGSTPPPFGTPPDGTGREPRGGGATPAPHLPR